MSGRRRRAGDPMLLRRVKIYTDQPKLNIKGSKGREEVSGDLRLWALRRKICRLIHICIPGLKLIGYAQIGHLYISLKDRRSRQSKRSRKNR